LENFDSQVPLPKLTARQNYTAPFALSLKVRKNASYFLRSGKSFNPTLLVFWMRMRSYSKRGKIFSPFTGQNRVHSSGRVAIADPFRFFAMDDVLLVKHAPHSD
jgi:hypothetical protein